MESVQIYTGKKKAFFLLICSIVCIVISIWAFLEADSITYWGIRIPAVIRVLSIISVLFFVFAVFFTAKRLVRTEIIIILDSEGINLNPKKSMSEIIKWEDVLGFEEVKVVSTKVVIIRVKNPEYWLERETSAYKRMLMKINMNRHNTPFNVTASVLEISSDELIRKLNIYFAEYRR